MRTKKTICAIFTAVLVIAVLTGSVSAAVFTEKADDLKFLGLFLGTDLGYELDRAPTRAEAAALLVRLLGKEAEAKENNSAHPFTDVPEWANVYIGYLYENGLANGISADKFGSGELCTMQMFCTFVLRALGYSDSGSGADFTYAEAVEYAVELGLADDEITAIAGELFNRDCCVAIMHKALFSKIKGLDATLITKLTGDGAIEEEKVVELYLKAAEQGNAVAQYNLGLCYYIGYGAERNYEEAAKWWTAAAENGHYAAQTNLGMCYYNGEGVDRDPSEAVKWWTAAAEQGHYLAQYNLAWRYYNGEGVDKNPSEAVKWWTAAAEQDHVESQYELADCYHTGDGVEQNEAEAVKWWAKAAENGNTDAMVYLAWQYFDGEILENDYGKAVEWVTKAAEKGNEWAIESLEFMENNQP